MTNRCIEFHDSQLVAVEASLGVVRVELNAYVHASDGEPAVDAGTGWTQRLVLELHDGEVTVQPNELPLWILDGEVRTTGKLFDNILPLPFEQTGEVRFVATGANDSRIDIVGTSIRVVLLAEPIYVEDFQSSKG